MKKSIEAIWKEGFLKNDALVAPKLNDLYNQKSMHFVDTYSRRFSNNMKAILIGSSLFLVITFLLGIPVMGIGFFFILNTLVIVDGKLLKELRRINKGDSSFLYLKSFEKWLRKKHNVNRKMATIYYPLFFVFLVLGLWFSTNAQNLFMQILEANGYSSIDELSMLWIVPIILITIILGFAGGRLYDWDVRIVYGSLYDKLEEMIGDMEELRN